MEPDETALDGPPLPEEVEWIWRTVFLTQLHPKRQVGMGGVSRITQQDIQAWEHNYRQTLSLFDLALIDAVDGTFLEFLASKQQKRK